MPKQTSQKAELFAHALRTVVLGVFAVFVAITVLSLWRPASTIAAASSTINFQSRLETNGGSLAADGTYNITFHLFNSATAVGGTSTDTGCGTDTSCEWTEQYTYNSGPSSTDARVRVANGYLTVNLGSITAFPGTINWDQQQWLTMDIGGTVSSGTITWDGQMSPRLQLTAVPYAFSAGQLQKTSGSNSVILQLTTPTAASETITLRDAPGGATVCYETSSNCGFATGSGTAFLQGGNTFSGTTAGELGTNNNGVLNFRTNNTDKLQLDTSGNLILQQASTLNVASAAAGSQLSIQGGAATSGTNTGGTLLLQGGAGASTGASGTVLVKSNTNNSTSAFQVQNTSSANLFTVDTSNTAVVLGNDGTPSAFTIRGGAASGANKIGGNLTIDASNGTGAAGSGDLIFRTAAGSGTITKDASTHFDDGGGCAASTISQSFTVNSQSNQILIVGVDTKAANSFNTTSGVTYNGTNLTKLSGGSATSGTVIFSGAHVELWYMLNPPSGSHTLAANLASGTSCIQVGAVTYYNVDQTTPFYSSAVTGNNTSSSATSSSITVNSNTTSQVAIDVLGTDSSITGTGTGQTQQFYDISGEALASSSKPATASNTSMSWTFNTADWAQVGIALNPAGNSTADTLTDRLHITAGGNVGIDNSNPQYTLDVLGTGNFTAALQAPLLDTASAAALNLGTNNATAINLNKNSTVAGTFTVTNAGYAAFQKGSDYSTAGTSNNVNLGSSSLVRLTGSSTQTITGIANGTDGRLLTIVNAASQAATISNLSGSSSGANQIVTGTGGDISLPAGATLELVYDAGASVWRVVGSSAGNGGYILLQGSTPGTAQTGNFNISGTGIAGALLAATHDTASAVAMSIGNTNATAVNIGNTTNNIATTINGTAVVKPTAGHDSISAFQVQNAAGTATVFNVDTTNSQVTLRNLNDGGVVGSEMFGAGENLPNTGNWNSASGSGSSASNAHTSGSTTALAAGPALSVTAGAYYKVTYTVSGFSAGTITASIGGKSGSGNSGNGTYTEYLIATNTNNLLFTPSNGFVGTVGSVFVEQITLQTAVLVANDSAGATNNELRASTAANGNLSLGLSALPAAIAGTAQFNVAVGEDALQTGTGTTGSTALGYQSLQQNTTGSNNTAVGYQALQSNLTATNNTAVGSQALSNSTGGANSGLGNSALRSITSGSNNTGIGNKAGFQDATQTDFQTLKNISNTTIIGNSAQATCSNCVIIGGQGANAVTNVGIGTPNPTNFISAEPLEYNTGTVTTTSQPTTSVVGSGTTFTSAMVGSEIYIASASSTNAIYKGTIAAYTDATHITVSPNVTFNVSGAHFYILYIGLQVNSTGSVGIGTLTPGYALDVAGTGNFSTSLQAPLLDTASATALNIGTTNANAINLNKNTAVAANLTVSNAGNVSFQRGTDYSSTGVHYDINFGSASLYRLTGSSTQTIGGIAAGSNGQLLTLINAASQAAVINNLDATNASASSEIATGTGSNVSLPAGASLSLVYDSGASLWRVLSIAAATGGYIQLQGSSPGTAQTGNFNISGTGIAGTLQASTLDTASAIALNIGTSNATNINIGTNAAAHTIAIGNSTGATSVAVDCGTGACNFGTTATTHNTTVGSTNSTSTTTVQSGSGGVTLSGNTSISGTNTFTTGTGNVSLQGATTVSNSLTVTNAGYVAFQRGSDFSTTGSSNDVNFGTSSLVRLTGASSQTITGIANGTDGRILTLVNAAGQFATISDQNSSSSSSNRIITGTGADITLSAGASLSLIYDSGANKWRIVGSAGGTGSFVLLQGTTPGTAQTGNFNISGTGIAGTLDATTFDTASATAQHIGTNNATVIDLDQNTSVTGSKSFTVGTGLTTLQGGITVTGAAVNLNVSSNNATNINTGTSTGAVTIGTSSSGAFSINGGADSSVTLGSGHTLAVTAGNINITAGGVVQLAGGQATDITTAAASSATSISIKPGDTTGANNTAAGTTVSAGNQTSNTCGTSCTAGTLTLTGGSATGTSGTRNGGNVSIDAGSGATANGSVTIGGANAVGVTLGRSGQTVTSAGSISVNTGQNVTLQGGVFNQSFSSASAANGQVLQFTNTNGGGSSVALNGTDITLVGTDTTGGTNSNSAYYFENPTAHTNNNYYGLNFAGTGYTDVLRVNGSQIISGAGILQSAGLNGTYSNALTLNNSGNTLAGTLNGISLTSQADGFTAAGGTTSRTLTVTGADITIGSTIKPTSAGTLTVQSNGANNLVLNVGGAANVNIANGTTGSAVNIGNTTSNPNIAFSGSGTFGTTTGAVSLNGNTTVTNSNTFTVNNGLTTLQAGLTANGGAIQLNASSNNNTTINTGSSTGTVGIGNNNAGAVTIASGAASSFAVNGNTLALSGTNFSLNTSGVLSLAGGQTADVTTPNVSTGNGTANNLTVKAGDETSNTCGTGCTAGSLTLKAGSATGSTGTRTGGSLTLDSGTGSVNGAISIGTANAASITLAQNGINTTVAGSETVSQSLLANGGATVASNQNLTLQGGTGVFSQTYSNGSAGSAQTLSITNSNSGGSSVALKGYDITLAGHSTSGGINSISSLYFEDPTAIANNNFYALNFQGTNYTDILRVNGTQLISGAGILQSAALSGTYGNALTFNNAANVYTGTTYNNLSLTSAADGFTVAGGTTSRTLTVTGASITIGNTIKPTVAGTLAIQSNGANDLTLDVGGAANVNIATGTNGTAINLGNTTSNPNIVFNGSGNFSTTTGTVSLQGNTTVTGSNTFTSGTGAVLLKGATTVNSGVSFIANGSALFKINADSSTAFQVQNQAGRNLLAVDTTGTGNVSVGNAATEGALLTLNGNSTNGAQVQFSNNGNANSIITKTMIVNGTVNANDIVQIDTSNAGQVKQAVASSAKVFGIATNGTGSGGSQPIVISGFYQANANGTINIGDVVVSSSTAGQVTTAGSTTASDSVIGLAMSTVSSGKVWVYLNLGLGGSDNLQTVYNKATGGTTPEIKLDSTRGAVDIQDADTTVAGSLLTVRGSNSSNLGASLFDVQSTGDASVLGNFNTPFGGFGAYGNLLTYSEQFDNAAWTATNVTVTGNDAGSQPAPDTTSTADKLVSASSGTATVKQTYSSAGNLTYTFSVWLKTNSSTQPVQLRIDSNGTPGTGTAASFTATTTWQRFWVTQAFSGSTTTVTPTIIISNTSATVAAWGADLVQSSTPGVYARTVDTIIPATDGTVNNGATINGGASVNSTLSLGNFSGGGSIGTAASTVDIYTSISVAQTSSGQALTIPTPTANAQYGRMLYLSNVGTQSFTLSNIRIPPGDTATLMWSNTNGGASWQFAGAGASSIENQNASDQTADFRISGTGRANTSFVSPLFDSISGGLSLGTSTATGVTIGGTSNTSTITLQGSAGVAINMGNAAGSGVLTNNGATVNTTLALTDFATGGSIGTAANTVDKYSSISIAQTTAGQTLTIPNPTASTTYGRTIYLSNIGTASFILGGIRIPASDTAALVWSNSNGAASWQFAGAGGSSIENQNTSDQTADFRISGTGRANTSFTSPLFDSISGALSLGTSTATGVTIGGTTNTTSLLLQGAAGATYTLGTSNNTGGITVGNSTATNTISIGAVAGGSNTQTINIGNSTTANSTTNVALGSTIGGTTNINGGTGVNINANTENTGYLDTPFGGLGNYGNLILRSEQFDNASWTKTNVTAPTANTVTSPDNNTTAESLADSASGGSVSQASTTAITASSTTYTFSVWLKTASSTQAFALRIDGSTTGTGTAATGTATTTWQRFSVTQALSTSSFTGNVKVLIFPGGTGASGTVSAWGAQLVQASVPQVYVRSVGATVAASDGIVNNGTEILQNAADTTTAFQILNASGTAILTVNTSSGIFQIGSSSSNSNTMIFALNNNDGTATPTEVDGGMYYNNSTSQFECGENGFWVSCGVPPRDHSFDLYDEFMNGAACANTSACPGIGGLNWLNTLIGVPGSLSYLYNQSTGNAPAADVNRPGIMDIEQTGNGNNTGQTMNLGTASMKLGTSRLDLKTAVNITAPQSSVLIGLDNETSASTAPTTGVYFKETSAGNWNFCYDNATPAETCSTTCSGTGGAIAATAGTWYRLEIQLVSSSEVDFYVNGNKCALTSITYNQTNNVSPSFTSYKNTGTPTTQDIYVDYFELLGTTSAAR